MIMSELVPLERTRGEREIMQVETHFGEEVVWATDWALQSWGPPQGRQDPLAGHRNSGTNRKAEESLNPALEECMHAGLSSGQS